MPNISLVSSGTGSDGMQYLTLRVDGLQNPANQYYIYIIKDATGQRSGDLGVGTNTYSDTVTWTGLADNTSYSFTAEVTPLGSTVRYYYGTFSTGSSPPPRPDTPSASVTGISGKDVTIEGYAGLNTTGVQIRASWGTNYSVAVSSNSFYATTITAPDYSTSYSADVYAYNANYYSSSGSYVSFTTGTQPDNPPTISISSYSGANAITINWSASDDKGLRSTDTFALYISGAGDSTLGFKQYASLGTTSFTFTSDRNGNSLVNNSVYLVRVVAVDNANQTSYDERYVTYTKTRPSNFSWTYSKSSGNSFNLTYSEWNNLLLRINEFREYKGFTPINTFTFATSGMDFYASMYRQVTNTISTLTPPLSPPVDRYTGDTIYADDINRLRDSLNSIT